ncbi:MAG: sigma-70 family RNA polymerase sigma factor [Bradyrhizobium sp.]
MNSNSGSRGRGPPLTLVTGTTPFPRDQGHKDVDQAAAISRDLDWSILMARAQAGDGAAYRRLLEEITPFLRSLAARRHRDPHDVEDAVQDILLTIHAIRVAYDPTRPFGPWLLAIANRRLVDRLRRQGRRRARETALTAAHETFSDGAANIEEKADYRSLEAAVERLPHRQRLAIRLLKLKELSLKEAAEASQMSVASLKVATHRALQNLRKMLFDRSDL